MRQQDTSCSEDESDFLSSDYESTKDARLRCNDDCNDDDDAEDGVASDSTAVNLPPGVVRSLRSVLLSEDPRPPPSFPLASALCSALLPLYYLRGVGDGGGDPLLAIVLTSASLTVAVRFRSTGRALDALRRDCGRREWDALRASSSAAAAAASVGVASSGGGGEADAALRALDVLARLDGADGGRFLGGDAAGPTSPLPCLRRRRGGGVGGGRAAALVRAARNPRIKARIAVELDLEERRRRGALLVPAALSVAAAAAFALLRGGGAADAAPLVCLVLLLLRDARSRRRAADAADRLADDLYALATDDADVAGGRRREPAWDRRRGSGGGGDICVEASDICASAGKSWVISPLFEKLRERRGGAGGGGSGGGGGGGEWRRYGADGDRSFSPGQSDIRSARRRRRKGNTHGRAGVV